MREQSVIRSSETLSSRVGKKEVVIAAVRLCKTNRTVKPGTAARCLTQRSTRKNGEARHSGTLLNTSTDKVKMEEQANCFTLLKRITGLKCVNSKVRSNVKCYSLDRDSPKGSCHLVEPTWVTHLYGKAIRIVDLECIEHTNQQRNWNPVKMLAQSAAWKSEMDISSVLKWTEAQCWKNQCSTCRF